MASPTARGFTLVELLVVMAVLVALLALLFPAFREVRFIGEITKCAAEQADFGRYVTVSAMDDGGKLGGAFVPANTGRNTWDVGRHWADDLLDRGMPVTSFYCPRLARVWPTEEDFLNNWYHYSSFRRIGYGIWVSREFYNGWAPPDPGDTSHSTFDNGHIPGPKEISDAHHERRANPIITCIVATEFHDNPYPVAENLADPNADVLYFGLSTHRRSHGGLGAMNQTFIDGSTHVYYGNQLLPRYRSNNGQPIMWR